MFVFFLSFGLLRIYVIAQLPHFSLEFNREICPLLLLIIQHHLVLEVEVKILLHKLVTDHAKHILFLNEPLFLLERLLKLLALILSLLFDLV